jgi:IS1 family transposase
VLARNVYHRDCSNCEAKPRAVHRENSDTRAHLKAGHRATQTVGRSFMGES